MKKPKKPAWRKTWEKMTAWQRPKSPHRLRQQVDPIRQFLTSREDAA